MKKVLSFINKTFSSLEHTQSPFKELEEIFSGNATLPKNVRISDQLEYIGESTDLITPESPQIEAVPYNTLSYGTSSNYDSMKNIPEQSARKFNRLLRILMISAVSTLLISLIINLTFLGNLRTFIEEIDEGTQIMSVLTRQMNLLSLAVFYSKQMLLYDLGVTFTLDRPTINSRLSNLSKSLTEDLKEIHKYDQGNNPVQTLSEVNSVWYEYYGDHFELEHKSLIDIQERMISLISNFEASDEVTVDNPYLIEMYRNGHAGVMESLNNTVVNIENAYEGKISEFEGLYRLVMLFSFCLIAILQGVGLTYILYILNEERVKIWTIFEQVPRRVIISTLIRLDERIVHKHDGYLEEAYIKSSQSCLPYKQLKEQKMLYFLTVLFCIFSLMTFANIYTKVLPRTHTAINHKLKLAGFIEQQKTYLYMSAFWSRECGYDINLVNGQNYYEEPKKQLNRTLEGLEFTHKKAYEGTNLSSNMTDIYLGYFNSTHYFEKGLHPRVSDIVSTYKIMCDLYETDLEAGRQYEIDNTLYFKQIDSLCDEVIDEFKDESEEKFMKILDGLLGFILSMLYENVFISILALTTVIYKLRGIFEKEAQFISFIPLEDSI